MVQIPTGQYNRETRAAENAAYDVSPEFMPVVRYYEREPRSGRASNISETAERDSKVWMSEQSKEVKGQEETRKSSLPSFEDINRFDRRHSRGSTSSNRFDDVGKVNYGYSDSNNQLTQPQPPPPPVRGVSRNYNPEVWKHRHSTPLRQSDVPNSQPMRGDRDRHHSASSLTGGWNSRPMRSHRFIEEEDENDTLVLGAADSRNVSLTNSQSQSEGALNRHRQFREERNLDDPDTPLPYTESSY